MAKRLSKAETAKRRKIIQTAEKRFTKAKTALMRAVESTLKLQNPAATAALEEILDTELQNFQNFINATVQSEDEEILKANRAADAKKKTQLPQLRAHSAERTWKYFAPGMREKIVARIKYGATSDPYAMFILSRIEADVDFTEMLWGFTATLFGINRVWEEIIDEEAGSTRQKTKSAAAGGK